MNRPLMFVNNNLLVEQLKTRVWVSYKKVKSCDFSSWYSGSSPIEKVAWEVKFSELGT